MTFAVLLPISLLMMAAAEIPAFIFRLWVYRSRAHLIGNVVVSIAVMSLLTTLVFELPIFVRFAAGASLGVLMEIANITLIHAWSFPDNRMLFARGPAQLVFAAGTPWGAIPAIAPLFASPLLATLSA